MILHPSGVTCFGQLICDNEGFKQTFEFVDVGGENCAPRAPAMNMSPARVKSLGAGSQAINISPLRG
jgi:hypothetical protein